MGALRGKLAFATGFSIAAVVLIAQWVIVWLVARLLPQDSAYISLGPLWDGWAIWDTGYYAGIAVEGYEGIETGKPAFFPAYPYLIRGFIAILGLQTSLGVASITAVIISKVAFLFAVGFLVRYVRLMWGRPIALYVALFVCLSPFSFFFAAGYTEPIFLLLAVLVFQAIADKRWLLAAVFVAVASGTRNIGIALLPALMWEMWQQRARIRDWILVVVIAPFGLVYYVAYLWWKTGDPLAFLAAQDLWSDRTFRIGFFFARIFYYPRQLIAEGPDFHDTYVPVVLLNFLIWAGCLALLYLCWKWLPRGLALFTTVVVIFPGLFSWISLGRYMLTALGIWIVLGIATHKYPLLKVGFPLLLACSTMLMTALMILFARGYWII